MKNVKVKVKEAILTNGEGNKLNLDVVIRIKDSIFKGYTYKGQSKITFTKDQEDLKSRVIESVQSLISMSVADLYHKGCISDDSRYVTANPKYILKDRTDFAFKEQN